METNQNHFGEHITIDGYGGDETLLNSKELIEKVLTELPGKLDMLVLGGPEVYRAEPNGKKDLGGWTGMVVIAESHISIHSFPHNGFVSADVYTCKNGMDTDFIVSYFKDAFQLEDVETHLVIRGTRFTSSRPRSTV